jgi:hypothetical protein
METRQIKQKIFVPVCCPRIVFKLVSSVSELQILMGSLLYLKQGIYNSPYSHLLDPIHWADICDVFTRDACSLLGLSVESPLAVR